MIQGADVFLGLSAAGVLKADMLAGMAEKPLVWRLANPRSRDYAGGSTRGAPRRDGLLPAGPTIPNRSTMSLLPYIFRGALDVGATAINEEMKMAAVRAIAGLAREERRMWQRAPIPARRHLRSRLSDSPRPSIRASSCASHRPWPRLRWLPASQRDPFWRWKPISTRLNRFVFRSGLVMKPVFSAARSAESKRVVYADGEDERVLRAAQVVLGGRDRPANPDRPALWWWKRD